MPDSTAGTIEQAKSALRGDVSVTALHGDRMTVIVKHPDPAILPSMQRLFTELGVQTEHMGYSYLTNSLYFNMRRSDYRAHRHLFAENAEREPDQGSSALDIQRARLALRTGPADRESPGKVKISIPGMPLISEESMRRALEEVLRRMHEPGEISPANSELSVTIAETDYHKHLAPALGGRATP